METVTLAGGCFWCLEAVFTRLRGVDRVQSGYAGGHVENPSYRAVCTGNTGHAEVVQIDYDPQQVSYRELLEVFFGTHDPTTVNRQGNDVGTQYRSAIFYHNEAQQQEAKRVVKHLTEDEVFDAPIVTEIVPLNKFYPAEDYHSDYFARNPEQPYCQAVISPKVSKLRQKFAAKLKRA
jgi:peptide-methionine (S)-S-oxide reductase